MTEGRATAVGLILWMAGALCSGAMPGNVKGQALFQDPVLPVDPPESLESFTLESRGSQLLVRALLASGRGPHPTVALLHGFPGDENNFDVAHALRRIGWNVVVMHYRGAWGSEGLFTFGHVLEDIQALVDHLVSPGASDRLRLDAQRLFLVGHSMGGFAALLTAARRDDVAGAASLAGFNFGASAAHVRGSPVARKATVEAFSEALAPLNSISADELVQEYLDAGRRWDLRDWTAELVDLPILLVGAGQDLVAPLSQHHVPLVEAFERVGHDRLASRILDDGHGFSSSRIALTETLAAWLMRHGGRGVDEGK